MLEPSMILSRIPSRGLAKGPANLPSYNLSHTTLEAADLISATSPLDDLGDVTLQAERETDAPAHTSSK